MTYNKKVSFGKVAGISLISIVMMFAAAAPSMNQAFAGIGGDIVKTHTPGFDPECFTGITIVKTFPTVCVFSIQYFGSLAIIEDTVPAEWEVLFAQPFKGNCTFDTKNNGKSATKITCDETNELAVLFIVQTRESPGNKNPNKDDKWKPTSCGPLPLNDGAVAYASFQGEKMLEEVGPGIFEPIVIDVSNTITLEAVDPDDLDCDGVPNEEDFCIDSDPINFGPIDGWGCDTEQAGSDD